MTMRGFLACYLGAVVVVGAVGGSAYEGLRHHRHEAMAVAAAKPVTVAEVTPEVAAAPTPNPVAATSAAPTAPAPVTAAAPAPVAASATPVSQPPSTASWPKLRPHVATAVAPKRAVWPRTTVAHAPVHHPTIIARSEAPVYASEPYAPPPPPPQPAYYGYPGYYPYPGYYAYYYPRYGYYRSF